MCDIFPRLAFFLPLLRLVYFGVLLCSSTLAPAELWSMYVCACMQPPQLCGSQRFRSRSCPHPNECERGPEEQPAYPIRRRCLKEGEAGHSHNSGERYSSRQVPRGTSWNWGTFESPCAATQKKSHDLTYFHSVQYKAVRGSQQHQNTSNITNSFITVLLCNKGLVPATQTPNTSQRSNEVVVREDTNKY